MQISLVGEGAGDAAAWDAWIAPRSGAITDLAAWRDVVRDAYGIRSHFLAAMDDGRIAGTLGLYEIRHPLFGHYLTTAPFGNDGGWLVDDAEAAALLGAEARATAERVGAAYLVIRTRALPLDGFQVARDYVTSTVDLEGGSGAVWDRLPSKTRNQVRHGMKEGFTIATGHAQLGAFFRVFHQHMRELGSPAHSRRYYEKILEHVGTHTDFLVVKDGATVVAGAMLCVVGGTAMNVHTVSLRAYNRRCPNYLLYWRMLETSAARGLRWFDMGRSRTGSSQLDFKRNWGSQETPLTYNYHLRTLAAPPDVDPRNAKYRAAIALWRRMPLALTMALGPRLIAGIA